jgi:hypothetical protein
MTSLPLKRRLTFFARIGFEQAAGRDLASRQIHDKYLEGARMNFIVNLLILLPAQIASHFSWAGPLIMRLIVGYTFMLTGWGKLTNLAQVTENFIGWGIPFPKILTPSCPAWSFSAAPC